MISYSKIIFSMKGNNKVWILDPKMISEAPKQGDSSMKPALNPIQQEQSKEKITNL